MCQITLSSAFCRLPEVVSTEHITQSSTRPISCHYLEAHFKFLYVTHRTGIQTGFKTCINVVLKKNTYQRCLLSIPFSRHAVHHRLKFIYTPCQIPPFAIYNHALSVHTLRAIYNRHQNARALQVHQSTHRTIHVSSAPPSAVRSSNLL